MIGSQLLTGASRRASSTRPPATARLAALVALAAVAAATPVAAQQPTTPVVPTAAASGAAASAAFTPSSASAEAREATTSGLEDMAYVFTARATTRFSRALAADPTFGLARAFRAAASADLTPAEKEAEATRGVADAAKASAGELMLAAAARELAAGRNAAAQPLFRAASEVYPDDPTLAMWAAQDWGGKRSPAEDVAAYRTLTGRSPSYGAAYNLLTYAHLAAGDTAAALGAAGKQVELAPTQPNPHDTYAEVLQAVGRLDEAAEHYMGATKLDSSFTEGYVGVAEVRQLQKRNAEARAELATALRRATGIGDSLRYMEYLAQSAVYANDLKGAQRQLEQTAQLAEQRRQAGAALTAHANLATVSALMGDKASVAPHLADARRLAAPADSGRMMRMAALAYFAAGMTDSLRATLAGHDDAHVAMASLALQDRKADDAMRHLDAAKSASPLAEELSAEAHAQLKHADVARTTRQQLVARRSQLYYNAEDMTTAVALRRAAKM